MSYRSSSSIALALAALGLAAGRAAAADLDPGYAQVPQLQEEKVEFGSGWYVRGDMAVARSLKPTTSPVSFDTTNPAVIPVPPTLSFSSDENISYTASLGAGYQVNQWFRADAIFDFHKPTSTLFQGAAKTCPGTYLPDGSLGQEGCSPHYDGALTRYDALINGYIDLGTWHRVTPYLGAGAGLAFGHYSASIKFTQSDGTSYNISPVDSLGVTHHEDFDTASSGTYYNFAFALMAGVAVDVFDHTKLDIGYRYLNMGRLPGYGGVMYQHEVRAGLRYMIDN